MKSQLEKIEDEIRREEPNIIFSQMKKVMSEISFISKERTNTTQGFKFRGIDDLYNHLHGLFAKHGIFSTPTVLEKTREDRITKNGASMVYTTLKILYRFYAEDGSSFSSVVYGEASDSGDKSTNKAMSAAHKYALIQIFSIPTDEEKDPDSESHDLIPKDQKPATAPKWTPAPPAWATKTSPKSWHPEFMFTFGKHKGKTFNDIAYEDLESYIQFLKRPDPKKTSEENQKNYKYNEVIFKAFDTWKMGMKAIGAAPKEEEPPPPSDEDYSDIPL